MTTITPIYNIQERTYRYAVDAIALYELVQKQRRPAGWIIAKQYLRSATSIGANMEEAKAGESRADFIHKCSIAQKEARESLYWLRLLASSRLVNDQQVAALIRETDELVSIITAIAKNARRNAAHIP